ncbi:hypothetical protein Ssi03_65740 [Sphaerisporangium siamense]|uniref:Peptidoglycan/LPS O-acetylase OafA/YrhL n=1 Tax=Sphaerisporangium siamense TaxID=795645 RepID=A0A7W7GGG9_9ACTN|nr:acyltransferase [Sphaerisporangium siamense]MBB4706061.1 peptidoglycan/LPS O-acetylase OafA/YrhL [Sphaerisporangium siamense]GII88584.1 hypothetical protein Ssi03_65740 [Sphaerisporangium siamense]
MLTAGTGAPHSAAQRSSRLAWLDALRGLGATAVLLEHMLYRFTPGLSPRWFSLGMYGVLVFFLVSGYIIPASLERHGDVRAFWVGRFLRLYPLYIVVVCLVLALAPIVPIRAEVTPDLATVAAHVTMLLDVVGSGGVTEPMWTLSYEMVFYLVVTALFATGLHRRSALWAVVFAGVAVVVGLLLAGPVLPRGPAAFVSLAVFAAGFWCVFAGRGRARTAGALALGALGVTLLLLGGRTPWLGPGILAVMFTGTVLYRWERGQASATGAVAVVTALLLIVPFFAYRTGWWAYPHVWMTTVALAGATFAAGMALRHRAVPRPLAWLGLISYSVYLVHVPLLKLFVALFGDPGGRPLLVQALLALAFVAVVLGVSALTYRYVERPARRLSGARGRSDAAGP